jgi:hypothetical protein
VRDRPRGHQTSDGELHVSTLAAIKDAQ